MRLLLPLIVSGDLVLGGQGQPGEGSGAPGTEGEHATSCQERHGGTQGVVIVGGPTRSFTCYCLLN